MTGSTKRGAAGQLRIPGEVLVRLRASASKDSGDGRVIRAALHEAARSVGVFGGDGLRTPPVVPDRTWA